MPNYTDLKNLVNSTIIQNTTKKITGTIMNNVINQTIDVLGDGANIRGVADLSTVPSTADGNVAYFATEGGTYTNFNNVVVEDNTLSLITNISGSWSVIKLINITDYSSDITLLNNKVTTNENNIDTINTELNTIDTSIGLIEDDITELTNRVDTNENSIDVINNELNVIDTSIGLIEDDIVDINEELDGISECVVNYCTNGDGIFLERNDTVGINTTYQNSMAYYNDTSYTLNNSESFLEKLNRIKKIWIGCEFEDLEITDPNQSTKDAYMVCGFNTTEGFRIIEIIGVRNTILRSGFQTTYVDTSSWGTVTGLSYQLCAIRGGCTGKIKNVMVGFGDKPPKTYIPHYSNIGSVKPTVGSNLILNSNSVLEYYYYNNNLVSNNYVIEFDNSTDTYPTSGRYIIPLTGLTTEFRGKEILIAFDCEIFNMPLNSSSRVGFAITSSQWGSYFQEFDSIDIPLGDTKYTKKIKRFSRRVIVPNEWTAPGYIYFYFQFDSANFISASRFKISNFMITDTANTVPHGISNKYIYLPYQSNYKPKIGEIYTISFDYEFRDVVTGRANLFNSSTVTNGQYLSNQGGGATDSRYSVSDYISIKPNTKYVCINYAFLGFSPSTCFYDSNKTFISGINNENSVGESPNFNLDKRRIVTSPSNAAFMRVSVPTQSVSTFRICEGEYSNYGGGNRIGCLPWGIPNNAYAYERWKYFYNAIDLSESGRIYLLYFTNLYDNILSSISFYIQLSAGYAKLTNFQVTKGIDKIAYGKNISELGGGSVSNSGLLPNKIDLNYSSNGPVSNFNFEIDELVLVPINTMFAIQVEWTINDTFNGKYICLYYFYKISNQDASLFSSATLGYAQSTIYLSEASYDIDNNSIYFSIKDYTIQSYDYLTIMALYY